MGAVRTALANIDEQELVFHAGGTGILDDNWRNDLQVIQLTWNIDAWEVIRSSRPGIGKFIIAFQKLIRSLTWWYLFPITVQISNFNSCVAHVLDAQARQIRDLQKQVEQQQIQIAALQKHPSDELPVEEDE